jgi:hypothetical protein
MNYALPIIICLAIAGFVVFLLLRIKNKRQDDAWKVDTESRARRIMAEVPAIKKGKFAVYYEKGLVARDAITEAFIVGVDRCDEKGRCVGYDVDRNNMPCSVVVFASETDSQGNPAFRVPIAPQNPYYGSEYDKGSPDGGDTHYILAAGQTIASGTPLGFICVVGYPPQGKESYFSTCAEYEREHDLLAWFNGEKYEATKYHGPGAGHPLIICP